MNEVVELLGKAPGMSGLMGGGLAGIAGNNPEMAQQMMPLLGDAASSQMLGSPFGGMLPALDGQQGVSAVPQPMQQGAFMQGLLGDQQG